MIPILSGAVLAGRRASFDVKAFVAIVLIVAVVGMLLLEQLTGHVVSPWLTSTGTLLVGYFFRDLEKQDAIQDGGQ